MTTAWERAHLDQLEWTLATVSSYTPDEIVRLVPDLYLWDLWPVRLADGELATVDGNEMWMALSAPSHLQPGQRHDVARIRFITRRGDQWVDRGHVFGEGESIGSREWAGCARDHPESQKVEVIYTAAGTRGESAPTFQQRIVTALGTLGDDFTIKNWDSHREMIAPGGPYQSTEHQDSGQPGFIKAFRDPFLFVDPESGQTTLLFTASLAESNTDFNGAVGAAREHLGSTFSLLSPLITADGINNELERPHVVYHQDLYYLFFSTQARTFHPDVVGPTGLYGFVGESLDGSWRPINDSGLVLRNPEDEPFQAYSWLVLNDLSIVSFVDFHNLRGLKPEDVEAAGFGRDHFGGTLARVERIELDGAVSRLIPY